MGPRQGAHETVLHQIVGLIPIACQDARIAPERWNFAFDAEQQISMASASPVPRHGRQRPVPRAYLPGHVTPSAALASVINAWKNAGDWPIKSPERVNAVAAA